MLTTFTSSRMLAVALLALSGAVSVAQGAGAAKSAEGKAAAASAAKEKGKAGMSGADIRKLYQEVRNQRDVMIADFDALAKQMKDATEEQKKQIREKMEAQKKAFEEVTNALHKQIRDEQRKQRQQR